MTQSGKFGRRASALLESQFRKRDEDHDLSKDGPEFLWRVDWKKHGLPYCGVYVISTDSLNPCKIGVAQNAVRRLTNLQIAHWRLLQVSEYRWVESSAAAFAVEKEAHSILSANGKGLLGEWFDVRPKEAVEAIEWAGLTLGIEINNHAPTFQISVENFQNIVRTASKIVDRETKPR